MPMISIHCPNCGQSYTFLDSQGGMQFTCLECGDIFVITVPREAAEHTAAAHRTTTVAPTAAPDTGATAPQPQTKTAALARKNTRSIIAYFLAVIGLAIMLLAIWFLASDPSSSPATVSHPELQQALFDEALRHISNNDDVSLAKTLRKMDANADDSEGITLLIHAVCSQKNDLVNVILNAGANINQLNSEGQSALFYAVRANDAIMTQLLLNKGADVNARDAEADSCVGVAAEAGFEDIIELLTNHTLRLDEPKHKEKAIFRAISNKHDNCAKQLLRKYNVDVRDHNGNTPLIAAIHAENSTLVRYLIDQGANPNLRNKTGETPVFIAMQHPKRELISLFSPSIIDWDEANTSGVTISMLCAQAGDYERLQLSLTDNNIHRRDKDGRNVLYYAATAGQNNLEMLEYLLERNIDTSSPTLAASPLYAAVAHDNHSVAKHLLDVGCAFGGVDDGGNNLLMMAAKSGNGYVVQALVEKGVDLLAMNNEQQTALSIAISRGHRAIANYLKSTGEQRILDMILQVGRYSPRSYAKYQELMTQFANLEKLAQGYDEALATINNRRQSITNQEIARQADVITSAISNAADIAPQDAIKAIESAIEACPMASNLNKAMDIIRRLQEKQRARLEKQRRVQQLLARIAAMSNTEREKEIDDFINKWLGDMKIGRDTNHYWKSPSLCETLYSVQSWEILAYGPNYEKATVIISSSTKGGFPIRVSWNVWFLRDNEAMLKIALLNKM